MRMTWLIAAASTLTLVGGIGIAEAIPAQAYTSSNINNVQSDRCIGISGNDAGIWNCTSNADQEWHQGATISGYYTQYINNKGQCLGVAGGSSANGARVVGWTCEAGHKDQYWWHYCLLDGRACIFINYDSPSNSLGGGGKVLGVAGGSESNGAAAVLWTNKNGDGDQNWIFEGS